MRHKHALCCIFGELQKALGAEVLSGQVIKRRTDKEKRWTEISSCCEGQINQSITTAKNKLYEVFYSS